MKVTTDQNQGVLKKTAGKLVSRHLETLLAIPGGKLYRRFKKAAEHTEATQLEVLRDITQYAKDSEFGRAHNFASIDSYEKLKSHVSVNEYEDLRPFIDRHKKGEPNVLFPGKPMMYTRTSGTTALSKFVPVTPYNFKKTIQDRGKLWIYGVSRQFPGILKGKNLSIVSPAVEGHTEDGTPFGSLSGLIFQNLPDYLKLTYSIPYSALTIKNHESKQYTLLRCALTHNVSAIFTGNPATVLNMVTNADKWKEDLIRDIHNGTLRTDLQIDPVVREEVERNLRANPQRASVLEKIATSHDQFKPAQYWPNLKLVHTWKNGNCRLMIPKLQPWFKEGTPILDFGYIATEINATDLIDSKTDGSILQIKSGFYEFVPVEERDNENPSFLMAHQLEVGKRYYLYVTTYSGLYRYDMNDIIEVVGHFHQTPIFIFLYKGKGVTSMQGEKLSEGQLIEAIHTAGNHTQVQHDFFIGYADTSTNRYDLYIELAPGTSSEDQSKFERAIDQEICRLNIEYEAKRESERLAPLKIIPMGEHFFARYRKLRLDGGAHEGQLKWLNLSATAATKERLQALLQ